VHPIASRNCTMGSTEDLEPTGGRVVTGEPVTAETFAFEVGELKKVMLDIGNRFDKRLSDLERLLDKIVEEKVASAVPPIVVKEVQEAFDALSVEKGREIADLETRVISLEQCIEDLSGKLDEAHSLATGNTILSYQFDCLLHGVPKEADQDLRTYVIDTLREWGLPSDDLACIGKLHRLKARPSATANDRVRPVVFRVTKRPIVERIIRLSISRKLNHLGGPVASTHTPPFVLNRNRTNRPGRDKPPAFQSSSSYARNGSRLQTTPVGTSTIDSSSNHLRGGLGHSHPGRGGGRGGASKPLQSDVCRLTSMNQRSPPNRSASRPPSCPAQSVMFTPHQGMNATYADTSLSGKSQVFFVPLGGPDTPITPS
jgi:hypothetical protein